MPCIRPCCKDVFVVITFVDATIAMHCRFFTVVIVVIVILVILSPSDGLNAHAKNGFNSPKSLFDKLHNTSIRALKLRTLFVYLMVNLPC